MRKIKPYFLTRNEVDRLVCVHMQHGWKTHYQPGDIGPRGGGLDSQKVIHVVIPVFYILYAVVANLRSLFHIFT